MEQKPISLGWVCFWLWIISMSMGSIGSPLRDIHQDLQRIAVALEHQETEK
jgi:hypothetical protein